ncbi:MAG: DUF6430 domain-containing protein [Christensenella sp.]
MSKIYRWYNGLSKRVRDSVIISATLGGAISTILSILGVSLGDWKESSILIRIVIVISAFLLLSAISYIIIGNLFSSLVNLSIRNTSVSIGCGDVFNSSGLRVIGCDTHFDTRVDDVVISKKSLHGKLILEHGNKDEIETIITNEANKLGLQKNNDGSYDFPLGTIIRYDSSVDNYTYLMLAMTELNGQHEAHTNMAKFELMLMKMWGEISRVYALNNVVLPVLGTGISRFDDGPKDKEDLLRCMLCTLNSSGVSLKSKVAILIYGDTKDIPLYEYKDMFHTILRR